MIATELDVAELDERDAIFRRGGVTGQEMSGHAWSSHALGEPDGWHPTLRAAVASTLASPDSTYLLWGRSLHFFFNDAYRPILGPRIAGAIGRTLPELWPDAFEAVRPAVEAAFEGRSSRFEDVEIAMARRGVPERTWWTFSFSPMIDDRGEVVGAVCRTNERTEAILAAEALEAAETRWRHLFETLQEGFVVGEVIRAADGGIVDWRYVEVNQAWSDLTGIPVESARGRTIREVLPAIEQDWIDAASVVDTGESSLFTREVGSLGRWYDGIVQPLEGDRFSVIFLDVTDRVTRDVREAATLELGDKLRDLRTIPEVSSIASSTMGTTLRAARAGFALVDPAMETVEIYDWCAPGVVSIAGRHTMRDYGTYIDDLKAGRDVIVRDVLTDERTSANSEALLALSIRTLINLPIMDHGRLSAIALVQFDEPRDWTDEETAFVSDVAYRVQLATARMEAEARRGLLNQELAHRLKNTLAVVSSIVTQTLRSSPDLGTAQKGLSARIQALSKAHDILLSGQRDAASLADVVKGAVTLHDEGSRVEISGPKLPMGPKASMTLSLIVHELATNSGKYGALSVPEGVVDVTWVVGREDGSNRPTLTFEWIERGGPPVVAPARRGFGTRMIEMGLSGSSGGSAEIEYAEEGLRCRIVAPLVELITEEETSAPS